jgi:hypothetical protein
MQIHITSDRSCHSSSEILVDFQWTKQLSIQGDESLHEDSHYAIFLASFQTIPLRYTYSPLTLKKKLHGLSPRANYTDRATAACRRSDYKLLRIKGATWSA